MSTGPLDPSIQELIRRKATKLSKKTGFKDQDRDDLIQELSLHVARRRPTLRSQNRCLQALLSTMLERRAANILRDRYGCLRRRNWPMPWSARSEEMISNSVNCFSTWQPCWRSCHPSYGNWRTTSSKPAFDKQPDG
jgi:hypothetical protein